MDIIFCDFVFSFFEFDEKLKTLFKISEVLFNVSSTSLELKMFLMFLKTSWRSSLTSSFSSSSSKASSYSSSSSSEENTRTDFSSFKASSNEIFIYISFPFSSTILFKIIISYLLLRNGIHL